MSHQAPGRKNHEEFWRVLKEECTTNKTQPAAYQ
jgi:hypothetical protein